MSDPALLRRTCRRLAAGEPIRILIGERFYGSAEIVPVPAFAERLRRTLIDDIEAQVAALAAPASHPEGHA